MSNSNESSIPNANNDDDVTQIGADEDSSFVGHEETCADDPRAENSNTEDGATEIQSRFAVADENADKTSVAYRDTSEEEVEVTTDEFTDAGEEVRSEEAIFVPADGATESFKQRIQEFRILGMLGQGGMGQVFRVFDQRYNREVALKRLSNTGAHRLKLFKTEFRELADISHPNLAALYELLSDGSSWYLTMELVEGVEFGRYVLHGDDQVEQRIRVASTEAQFERIRGTLPQLIRGLTALHDVGKFHRDIKESNVLVTRDGHVKLLDFGLVSNEEMEIREAANRGIQGTIPFIAPEQAGGRPASAASDWYAVGVMLFHLLTGRWPFLGTNIQQLSRKIEFDAPAPSTLRQSVPEDLNSLCVELMARDPSQRPTGKELRHRFLKQLQTIKLTGRRLALRSSAEFVGREYEAEQLDAAFNEVVAGGSSIVFIRGRSGYGKTTLARELLNSAEQLGAVVLSGRCFERESVPYKAWDDLIDGLTHYLSTLTAEVLAEIVPSSTAALLQVFPVLGRIRGMQRASDIVAASQREIRRQAFATLREILQRVGERQPLVLFIDDLQWGDDDSAMLCVEMLKPPNPPRLMLMATIRSEDEDRSQFLNTLQLLVEQLSEAPEFKTVLVDELSKDESIQFADTLMPDYVTDRQQRTERIAEEANGNPMFIQELARAGQQIEIGTKADATSSLDRILWKRILLLPVKSRRLLELLAIQGSPIEEHLAFVAAEVETDGPNVLGQLRAESLVRSTRIQNDDLVSVYHDRIRETIITHLDADTRSQHHLQLWERLEAACLINVEDLHRHLAELGTSASLFSSKTSTTAASEEQRLFDIAVHYDEAGDSLRALPFAFSAAQRAHSQFSLDAAEGQYRIAERGAIKADDSVRMTVAEGLGEVLVLRGDYQEALTRYKFALSLCESPATVARVKSKLAELHVKCARPYEAAEFAESVFAMSGHELPKSRLKLTLHILKEAGVQALHTLFPGKYLQQLAKLPERDQMLMQAAEPLTFSSIFTKEFPYALWIHLISMNLAERGPENPSQAWAYSIHALICSKMGFRRRQEQYAQRALEISERNQFLMTKGQVLMRIGLVSLMKGRIEECLDREKSALHVFLQTGDWFEINTTRVVLAMALNHKGYRKESIDQSRRIWRTGVETGDFDVIGIAMGGWVIASGGQVAKTLVYEAGERERDDRVAKGVGELAVGVFEYFQGNLDEAEIWLDRSRQTLKTHRFEIAFNVPVYCWRATVLRSQLSGMNRSDPNYRTKLNAARVAVREALKCAKISVVELPHALREDAEFSLITGKRSKALALLRKSLESSDAFGMPYQSALTNVRICELQLEDNEPGADARLAAAKSRLGEFDISESDEN